MTVHVRTGSGRNARGMIVVTESRRAVYSGNTYEADIDLAVNVIGWTTDSGIIGYCCSMANAAFDSWVLADMFTVAAGGEAAECRVAGIVWPAVAADAGGIATPCRRSGLAGVTGGLGTITVAVDIGATAVPGTGSVLGNSSRVADIDNIYIIIVMTG